MARGFLSGALWGVVVAGIGAGTASVVTGPVLAPRPDVTDAVRQSPAAPDGNGPEAAPAGKLREAVSPQASSPGIPDQSGASDRADGVADTRSTGLPETGAASELRDAPDSAGAGRVETAGEEPVLPNAQAAAPDAPKPETGDPSISSNPSQPLSPRPEVDESAPQMAGLPQGEDNVTAPASETPIDGSATPPPITATGETGSEVPPEVQPPAPFVVNDAADTGDARNEERDENGNEDGNADGATKPRVTVLLTEEDDSAAGDRPRVGDPAEGFGNLAPEVRTGRLPSLQTDGETAGPPISPLEQFSESVEIDGEKPMMSIVLIDDGSTPLGLEALESFPYPITFAIDTAWDDAEAAMRGYREAGFEVMALANLPEGARPQDAEVTLSTVLSRVPEAVAVLEGDQGGLQENRAVSDQVARILSETGHGLVMYPKGLNTAQSLARRAGVPSVTLFRDFDGRGQDAKVIRRFLDQAAFKAGQEGAVIMLGRLKPETISALLIWGLQDRASRLAFVPVSQVLLEDAAGG